MHQARCYILHRPYPKSSWRPYVISVNNHHNNSYHFSKHTSQNELSPLDAFFHLTLLPNLKTLLRLLSPPFSRAVNWGLEKFICPRSCDKLLNGRAREQTQWPSAKHTQCLARPPPRRPFYLRQLRQAKLSVLGVRKGFTEEVTWLKPWIERNSPGSYRRSFQAEGTAEAKPQRQQRTWHLWGMAKEGWGQRRRRQVREGRPAGEREEANRERRWAGQTSRLLHPVVKTLSFNWPEMGYNEQNPRWIK